MATVVRMPSVLAGATEAAITNWLVSPGDTVTVGQPIAEIETEKALVEYAAEQDGTVGRLVLGEGETGEIGDPIAVLLAPGEADADIDAALGAAGERGGTQHPVPPGAASRNSNGTGAGAHSAMAGPGQGDTAASTAAAGAVPVTAVPVTAGPGPGRLPGGRIFASPLVRKLAGERGADLAWLTGTGPNGRITRRDLERYLAAGPAAGEAAADAAGGPEAAAAYRAAHGTVRDAGTAGGADGAPGTQALTGGRLIPHTPMRRAIARRLSESKATVPHFYMAAEPVVDDLLALRRQVNESSPVKVSVNDLVVMAVTAAFTDVPEANVTWTDEGLLAHDNVDISIAVATDGGLVTPVLRDAGRLRLSQVARRSADLAARARERRLRQHELEGGTFAVSNLGMYGTVEFSAIINPPQSGILAVGAARQQPVAADGAVTVATVMRCTLSVDHRAIDGALAARWLAAFTARMENPLSALV